MVACEPAFHTTPQVTDTNIHPECEPDTASPPTKTSHENPRTAAKCEKGTAHTAHARVTHSDPGLPPGRRPHRCMHPGDHQLAPLWKDELPLL